MDVPLDRRRFLAGIVTAAAASRLGIGVVAADPSPASGKSFDAVKQVDVGVLDVGYVDAGPRDGPPVEHRLIDGGIGHNLPQEAPRAFAGAVIDVSRRSS